MSNPAPREHGHIDVAYTAHLARLYLTEEEVKTFQGELERIVEYVEQLAALDVEGIEPTAHAVPVKNVLRADEVRPGLDHHRVMANAPEAQGGQFVVPRILEE